MNIKAVSKTLNTVIKRIEPQIGTVADMVGPCVTKDIGQYGKHKVKRYLYHLTTEENYNNILKTGRINPSVDSYLDYEGIFMTELDNLAKCWRTSKTWDQLIPENKDGVYLSIGLLSQVSKDSGKVVCLRIPTKYLDHDMLKIRSQNRLCRGTLNEDYYEHMEKGAPAKAANLYKQRREAIEYIYQDVIPVEQVELVGKSEVPKVTLKALQTWTKSEQKNVVLDVFRKIFQGQPESKGLDAIF